MGHNWISFGLPPMETLLRPAAAAAIDLLYSSHDDQDSYMQYLFPPAPTAADLKLEDLLTPAVLCSDPLPQVTDAQDSSSISTAVVEASSPSSAASHRSSVYRGVTRHRWTGRYEAHLWDNTCRREGQKRKGRQVYLGGYDKEEKAAIAYDLATLKYWGPTATTNFPVTNYSQEIEKMMCMSKQEFIASLRRRSSGFSRGASIYRGVTRHHQHGRWQARIGRVAGNKDLYLGTFVNEEEAAEAYDVAAIKFRGPNAVTNFELSRYDVEAIANADLPIGAAAKRIKVSLPAEHNQLPFDKVENGQHLDNVPPHLFGNFMQLQAPPGTTAPCLTFCSLVESASAGVGSQDLYLFTAKAQHKNVAAAGACSLD